MSGKIVLLISLLWAATAAGAEDGQSVTPDQPAEQALARADGVSPEQPRTMSGMSILGNEEAPKSLVIVPWKGSEMGEDLNLTDTLDQRARPVDKDVFLRELGYYAIRSGKAGER